jgi:hypothetical protein
MYAELCEASLPKAVKLLPDSQPLLHRPAVHYRKRHFGGLTTLVLSISVLVVCLVVLAHMLGGGASSSTGQSQQESSNKSSVISRSSAMGRVVLPADTTSYTRGQWATDLLKAIGNASPSQKTVYWVVNWTYWETSSGDGAAYNLLNTTQQMPGSWSFNSAGVQNFTSYAQGIHANAIVLENGYYPTLLTALQTNDLASLASPSDSIQSELGTWGTGWRGWGFSAAHANDIFS